MKLMGHRGARDRAPENTLRSFDALIQSGLTVFEFDIHYSKDAQWVVHHDDTLDRTTNSTGKIADKTWDELSQVRTKEGDPLPRLQDILELIRNRDIEIQIELKNHGDFRNLKSILDQVNNKKLITVISFNHRWLLEFKDICPDIQTTCLMFALPVDPIHIIDSCKANGMSLNVNLIDKKLVDECHERNLLITAWNANDQETYLKMLNLGVDYLGTDVPYTSLSWSK
jgi:glycerophosphoryl diester phosphodiesterase